MSVLSIFFKSREFKVGTLTFDLILNENHNFSNTITDHDVEDGSVISDHIKNDLENGTLTGLISNFSLKKFGFFTDRVQDAFNELERIWKEKELISIITMLKRYDNVAIVNLSIPKTPEDGDAIFVSVSFRQFNIVKLKTVQIDTSITVKDTKSNINRQISPAVDSGRTTPIDLGPGPEAIG